MCVLPILLTMGCTTRRAEIAHAISGVTPAPVIREQTVAEGYHIACPDVVEIKVDGLTAVGGSYAVSPEGRIELAALSNPRVEGLTAAGLADSIASELDLSPDQVHCQVTAHRSRMVFVRGPIEGGERAVYYRGPENVVSFLRRCGGLKPGADVRDVHVVRGNVARGAKPQVFLVDLEAILLRGDARTNVLLEPFDEICIGELARSKIGHALPHWLRPVYHGWCGVFPFLCPHDWRQQFRDPEP